MSIIRCDRSFPEGDIGYIQVNSATLINPRTGRVFDRPSLRHSVETLSPANLAVYLKENPATDLIEEDFHAQMFSMKAPGQVGELLVWYHVDYTLMHEQDRGPVQPTLDRLTTYLRHRVAVRKGRETVLFPELAMGTHWRAGENSALRLLNSDLLKHILDLSV
jgi:hypothetical protein